MAEHRLSDIIRRVVEPRPEERAQIAAALGKSEAYLFAQEPQDRRDADRGEPAAGAIPSAERPA